MKDKLIEDMYSTINVSLDETDKTDLHGLKGMEHGAWSAATKRGSD